MQKVKNVKKSSISGYEFELVQAVLKSSQPVFNAESASLAAGIGKERAFQLIHSLHAKGLIKKVEKNKYALDFFHFFAEPLVVASNLVWPCYISFWSALSFHKFTEQLPKTVFIATTKRKKEIRRRQYQFVFVTISGSRFFGYAREKIGAQEIIVAEKEKALIDSLYLPRHAGGLFEASKALFNAWPEISKEKLVNYCLRMKNKSLNKRLGYLIESMNLKMERKLLEKLHKRIGKGYSKLNPSLPKTKKYEKKWLLILNEKNMLKWREII